MAKRLPEFDREMVRSDSQVIPVPQMTIPMPKVATATAAKQPAATGIIGTTKASQPAATSPKKG